MEKLNKQRWSTEETSCLLGIWASEEMQRKLEHNRPLLLLLLLLSAVRGFRAVWLYEANGYVMTQTMTQHQPDSGRREKS
ncbi:hypothetical protein CesoFtcFv8_027379 [Champsocephalus esox]|uniref:Uncharacterized protein n=1 Tax=Champsocephalus esox TaxID=159716 RepID=A0AAN7YBQ8_9TELE|nr:hypothetical protein CesoFtcFv8_027379 [Champsocephalus esox]